MTALPASWVERLFERLAAFYGAKFADLWRGGDAEDVKNTWAEALAGMTADEIRHGLDGCLTRDWPPTLPEFRKLCRPTLDAERAYLEAQEQMRRRASGDDVWSRPEVYWAASRIGCDLRQPYAQLKTRWAQALDTAERDIKAGMLPRAVPRRHDALPAPQEPTTPATHDAARATERMAEAKAAQQRPLSLRDPAAYEALIRRDTAAGKIHLPRAVMMTCATGCGEPAALSNSTNGSTHWYCRNHVPK